MSAVAHGFSQQPLPSPSPAAQSVALYGTVAGACPAYAPSATCNDVGFAAYAQAACVGRPNCTLSSGARPDPCVGTVKAIAAVANCSLPPGGFSPDGYVPPPTPPAPSSPFCGYKAEAGTSTLTLECVDGGVIDSLPVALYGLQTGTCPAYEPSPLCDNPGFRTYALAACVGRPSCTLSSVNMSDPCVDVVKAIAAVATCSLPPGGYSPDGPDGPGPGHVAVARVRVTSTKAPETRVQATAAAAVAAGVTLVTADDGSSIGAVPTPGQGCLYTSPTLFAVTRSQQSAVVVVPDGLGGSTYLFHGDRWGQSPDGLKGHEPLYVYPLAFAPDGSIPHITWNDTVAFDIDVGANVAGV